MEEIQPPSLRNGIVQPQINQSHPMDDIDNMDFELPTDEVPIQHTTYDKHPEIKDWVCVYPLYLDAEKSAAQGRRVPKELAVKNPAAIYMAETLRFLNLRGAIESDKRHPRDPLTFGRIRVELRDPSTKKWHNPQIKSKKELMLRMAKLFPNVKSELDKAQPQVAAIASASRSELSVVVNELANLAVKEPAAAKKKKKGRK